MNPRDVVITHARRTPIGKFLGALSRYGAVDLGVAAARAVRAGLPFQVPAFTVNMACASGMKAIALAAQAVAVEEAEIVLCGGTESMSRVPHFLPYARAGYRLGGSMVVDGIYQDGLDCPLAEMVLGRIVEEHLRESGETDWRARADRYALESRRRAETALAQRRFRAEIAPVREERPGAGAAREVAEDEQPRDGATLESLAALPPAFAAGGTITEGNASAIADGAAALLVMSAGRAEALGASGGMGMALEVEREG